MRRSLGLAITILAVGCGGPKAPAQAIAPPSVTTATAPTPPPPPAATTAPPPPEPAAIPEPVTPAPASATAEPAPLDAGVHTDGGKVIVVNSIDVRDTPEPPSNSRMPGDVIASLRPLFTRCFDDGMKKDPKLAGSVTMSAKIDKDGKVSAVTPKRLDGLNDAVVKCLSDKLKAAQFAAAGSRGYAASVDIPLSFSSSM